MLVLAERPTTANTTLESRWRRAAAELTISELNSGTWRDLHRAFQAEALGRRDLVERWLDQTEATILAAWEGYETTTVLDEEVTLESVLGHHLLREGAEYWLEALGLLRESLGQIDREAVLELAEEGQRLLVALGKVKLEDECLSDRFMSAWMN